MKWVKFRIKTVTEAEDIIISTLYDLGLEGAQIEDKVPLTAMEKEQMFVDILPDGPEDDGIAYLSFFVEEKEDGSLEVAGALIAGLVFGWLRSKHPTFGGIPEPSLWVLNNVGLNMFIAVVGIAAGPSFVAGFKEVGFSLFIIGALATAIPLLSGLLMGKYLFKFHPALTLGCTAGARTTTAALGAVQDAVESETPALGYTVTYAVGNTLLIIWGVFIVLLM